MVYLDFDYGTMLYSAYSHHTRLYFYLQTDDVTMLYRYNRYMCKQFKLKLNFKLSNHKINQHVNSNPKRVLRKYFIMDVYQL